MKKILGDNLRRLRQANRLRQQEVANGVGIKRCSLAAYEEGRCAPPLEVLVNLSRFYSHTVDDLLTENLEVSWKKKGYATGVESIKVR